MSFNHEDFTEGNYIILLKRAKINYNFINYEDFKNKSNVIIWRHDVDFSVHRSYRLAYLEADQNISSTFFLHLHNPFYNLMEKEIFKIVVKIMNLGHSIGLHFDPNYWINVQGSKYNFKKNLWSEKKLLENLFDCQINVFSFHNPDVGDSLSIEDDEICGMINTYSKYFRENYGYVSDSNGYWRFRRLEDVLVKAEEERLQVLTHPAWWTPEVLKPRERIQRCIDGRARKTALEYDQNLEKFGRRNVR